MIHRTILNELIHKYDKLLGPWTGRAPRPLPVHKTWSVPADQAVHCKWMLEQLNAMWGVNDSKLVRWFCFVQGVLWSHGRTTMTEMTFDNYRMFHGKDPE